VIAYRHTDRRFPFLWEDADQPAARWHAAGEGPVHYLADSPDGAWAQFLRHEGITDLADLDGIDRALWAIDIGDPALAAPHLPRRVLRGGIDTYPRCRTAAQRIRRTGTAGLRAPSAALVDGEAGGWRVAGGLVRGPARTGETIVLFGRRPDLVGWCATAGGRPPDWVLHRTVAL
jgi:hypothetical protein